MNRPIHRATLSAVRAMGALLLCLSVAAAGGEDLDRLLEGVHTIGIPGLPGLLSVFGKEAFPVVVAPTSGPPAPIAAAARIGKGRVFVLSHNGYFGAVLETADTGRLLANAVRWVGRGRKRIAVYRNNYLVGFLEKARYLARIVRDLNDLQAYDALYAPITDLNAAQLESVRAFVRNGGGLISGHPGWGWQQLHRGLDLATQNMGNRLLAPAGIVFGRSTIKAPASRRIAVSKPPALTHAAAALGALRSGRKLTNAERAQAVETLSRCVGDLPPDDRLLLPRLEQLLQHGRVPLPSAKEPLGASLGKVLLALQIQRSRRLRPQQVKAHPAAELFPGSVSPRARRVTRRLRIDTSIPGWHSTGLYAPPGEVIRARAAKAAPGLKIRIGAHKDRLWNKPRWRRAPEITRVFALGAGVTPAASAFGGLIYVEVPRAGHLGVVEIEIQGGVEAPLFVLGTTDLAQWRKSIRVRAAPWAELATEKVIITVPSKVIRGLDRPDELMRFWNRVMDACADLAVRPRARTRPERYVADEQISAGYMHAGYPIMTHLDAAPRFVDLARLSTRGDWGMFHEMGHNHQQSDWTFRGTTEVTCNLFSLYVMETVCSKAKGHAAMSPSSMADRIEKYRRGGRRFATWTSKPFLALVMYKQLKDAFGWKAYKQVFAEYRDLPKQRRPKNDAEKRDQWMVRFSRTVGRNLGPFFEFWGIPATRQARTAIADLPGWMPKELLDGR